jgi:hypothetical protein
MPCYDERNAPSYVEKEVRRDARHNSDVAEMLCWIIKNNKKLTTNKDIDVWWLEHQIRDKNK